MKTFLLLLCLALAGCRQADQKLIGQIFLTLESRDTIKLSLVPVLLVESNHAMTVLRYVRQEQQEERSRREEKRAEFDQKAVGLTSEIKFLEGEGYILQATNDAMKEIALRITENAQDRAKRRIYTVADFERTKQWVNDWSYLMDTNIARMKKLKEQIAQLEQGRTQILAQEKSLSTAPDEMTLLREAAWNPRGQTITDANGEFTIKPPASGNYVLVAFTERKRLDKTESFFWLLPPENPRTLFHNGNVLDK